MQKSTIEEKQFSLFNTFIWMICLVLGIDFVVSLIVGIGFRASGVTDDFTLIFSRPDALAIASVIAAILILPLIEKAAHQTDKLHLLQFLAIHPINKATLGKVLLAGFACYFFDCILAAVLVIDTPQIMLDIKAQTKTSLDMVLLVLVVCIVAPVIEEIIFRGLAYARIIQSRAGIVGAILITSFVFTVLHLHYEFIVLAMVFVFALLIGFVRYKTNNLIYCIALHMQLNILSTIELFGRH